ncbi:hypothetical protein GCM10018965_044440 [Nonomuraea roseola]
MFTLPNLPPRRCPAHRHRVSAGSSGGRDGVVPEEDLTPRIAAGLQSCVLSPCLTDNAAATFCLGLYGVEIRKIRLRGGSLSW